MWPVYVEEQMKYKGLAYCAIVVVVLQLIYGLVVLEYIPEHSVRGLFGDMFGGLTSLFSGLAFAGMIYAIILQSKELGLQREELTLTRGELAASREEQRKSAKAQEELVEKQLMTAKIQGVSAIVQGRYQYASSFGMHAGSKVQSAMQAEQYLVELINECSDTDLPIEAMKP
ncbi:hypothetical protein NMS74_003495 [Vibrio cholerae]|nr:hypothetical protein [Vibrio cholerae]EGQ9647797.1 hypothetical protein [Vibrio cholerae]EHS1090993.1 hypothetical protein [Vibrio cholerae]EJL6640995.1 hypothetical protein [Vibrio cholerae]EKE8763262.1 hypothetical protein [Vibrio cholerae]